MESRMDPVSVESIGHVVGIIAVVGGTAGVLLSIGLADTFSLHDQALSDLGASDADAPWLFNGAMILTGILSAAFFATLYRRPTDRYQNVAVAVLAIAGLSLVGVGLFPLDHPLHWPFGTLFFLAVTVGLALYGLGYRRIGRNRRANLAWNLALLHAVAWSFGYVALPGIALPELVGGAVFGIWIVVLVIHRGPHVRPNSITA